MDQSTHDIRRSFADAVKAMKNREIAKASTVYQALDNSDTSAWYYTAVQEATNSHDYVNTTDGYENWTGIKVVRDWEAFEKIWSDQNSASNPGEVVKD